MYVNTASFTLLHSHTFQPKRGYHEGVLIYFVSTVNKILVQMSHLRLDPHFVDSVHEMYLYSLG